MTAAGGKTWDQEAHWLAHLPTVLRVAFEGKQEDIKAVQELLRHSNISTTMNLCAQAFTKDAREAQRNVIDIVRNAPIEALPVAEALAVQPIVQ